MNFFFLLKCFLVGLSAASAMGPLFVLTFNKGAMKGFFKGLLTAFGAALGDGFLLFLGLIGALSFLEESYNYHVAIDFAGGFLLLIFGLSILFAKKNNLDVRPTLDVRPALTADSIIITIVKTFLSTILNPLTLFFFMFISTQILERGEDLSLSQMIMGSSMTGLGSLTILATVALVGSILGNAISYKNLRIVSIITGTIILGIGAYFFFDAIKVLIIMYS